MQRVVQYEPDWRAAAAMRIERLRHNYRESEAKLLEELLAELNEQDRELEKLKQEKGTWH